MDSLRFYNRESEYNADASNFVYPTISYIEYSEEVMFMGNPIRNITLTAGSGSSVYDGTTYSVNTYQITKGSLRDGDRISNVTISGSIVDAGTVTNTISNAVILNSNNENVTNTYNITYVNGTLTLAKRNVIMTSASDTKTYDGAGLSNDEIDVTGDGFATGEGATYDVNGNQTLVGTSQNAFIYTLNQGTKAGNYNITTHDGTLTVTDGTGVDEDPVDPGLVVWIEETSEPEDSGGYVSGETVTFSITVNNIYDEGRDITLSSMTGLTLAQAHFYNVSGGAGMTTTATHAVTSADELAGSYTATVNASVGGITKTCELTVDTQVSTVDLVLRSGSSSRSYNATPLREQTVTMTSGSLRSGDAITYNISGQQLFVGSSDNTFDYTITPAASADKYNITRQFGTLTVTDTNVSDGLVITVAALGNRGTGYGLGDEVEFRVTATNIYDTAIDIYLSAIEGLDLAQGGFERVSSGYTIETRATHTIGESDILNGSFTGTVTAYLGSNNVSPLNYSLSATGSATVQVVAPNGQLTVHKTTTSMPENDEAYDYGEEITYNIWVENTGNLTISDITIIDDLTGDEWTIEDPVAPGEIGGVPTSNGVVPFETSYYVEEPDILAGTVLNIATATGTSPDTDEPDVPVIPGEDPELTVEPDGHLTMHIEETSTPQNGDYYQLGETVTYNVWIENDGNLTINDIIPSDNVNGNYTWQDNTAYPKASYPQNSSYVLTPWQKSYTITQADVNAGDKDIIATATGESPDPDNPDATVDSATLTVATNIV